MAKGKAKITKKNTKNLEYKEEFLNIYRIISKTCKIGIIFCFLAN